jgi:hypothetical protein
LAGICAGVWAIAQWLREMAWRREDRKKERESEREERSLRQQELQWKQAELARELLDDIFDYKPSNDAWEMVDGETDFKDMDGVRLHITIEDVRRALTLTEESGILILPNATDSETKQKEKYIRWCFDALFYYLERLEQSLRTEVVRFGDLRSSATYYVALMATDKKYFQDYCKFIGFEGAVAFMNRFLEWQNKST